jgi:DNA replication protein DnaC
MTSIEDALIGKIGDSDFDRIKESFPMSKVCPTCDDTGSYTLKGVSYECDCNTQRLLQKHYFAANIGREYHDICLKDFIGENREQVVAIVSDYLYNFKDNFHYGLGLSFNGPFGTGKTFAMTCVLKELIKQGRDVYMITFDELIDVWGQSWHDEKAKKTLQDKLKRVEVLGLDELKTDQRNKMGFLADGLDNVIRHRTSNLLPTLVTTNLMPEAEEREFSKAFSLLAAKNKRVLLSGIDQRQEAIKHINYQLAGAHERRPIC